MYTLEFVRTYLDDLLCSTKGSFEDHLLKVGEVLEQLKSAKLRVNVKKSSFTLHEIEYLGYLLTREGTKPQPGKVSGYLT